MRPLTFVFARLLMLTCLVAGLSLSASAQIILQEDFEQGIPGTWTRIDVDGNNANSGTGLGVVPTSWFLTLDADATRDTCATSNSWTEGFDTGCNPASTCQADDWLITPALNLTSNNTLTWDALSVDNQFLESYEVRISTTTPTTTAFMANAALFTTTAESGTWNTRTVNLQTAGYSNQTVYIAFRHTSNDKFFLRVDNVVVQVAASDDLGVTDVSYGEYVFYPESQIRAIPLSGTIENFGSNTATNATLTTTIFNASNGFAQVYNQSANTPSLAAGAATTLNMPSNFTPADTGTYILQFVATMTQTDGNANNDTMLALVRVDESLFARDDALVQGGSAISSLGFGANSATNDIGNLFTLTAGDTLQQVEFFLTGGDINDVVSVNVYNTSGGLPTTLRASTVTETVLTAADTTRVYTLAMSGGPVFLPAGTYFFGVRGGDFVGFSEDIYTPGSVIGGNTTGGFVNLDDPGNGGFEGAFDIWPHLQSSQQQSSDNVGIISTYSGEYTIYPINQTRPVPFAATVENFGSNTATNVNVNVTVTDGLGNVVFTGQSFPTTVSPGVTSIFPIPSTFALPDTGAGGYLIEYLVSMDQADGDLSNDTSYFAVFVDDSLMARDDALFFNTFFGTSPLTGLGFNTVASQVDVGNTFNLNSDDTLHKVEFFLSDGNIGDVVSANVYATSGGVPTGNPIATTVTENVATANDTTRVYSLDMQGGPVGLTAGTYFIGIRGARFIGFSEKIYTPESIWFGANTVPFGQVDTLSQGPFEGAFTIWPYLASNNCPVITVNTTTTPDTCTADDGTATATPSGGTATYTYAWDANANNQTTQTATGLDAGTYGVTVTDANGCTGTGSATVGTTTSTITVSQSASTDNTSCSAPNGSVTVNATGGTAPYTYAWDANANNQTNAQATGLTGGTYNVTVTDANGCSATGSGTVGSTTATPSATFNTTDNTSCAAPNGSATATGTGGTGPYTFAWDAAANNQTGATASTLSGGSYTVTVTDANGCTGTATATVGSTVPVVTIATSDVDQTSCINNNGSATATPSGGTGPYNYAWDANANSQTTATAANLAAGTYSVTVADVNGCSASATATVGDGRPTVTVNVTASVPNSSCGTPNGSATVAASGGASYTYQWDAASGNQTGATASGLAAGTYSVTATETISGCTATASAVVGNNTPTVTVSTTTNPVTNCTSSNGSATATASGGGGGFTYAWDANTGNQTTSTASNLAPGTYTVTVTDANGCTATATATVADNRATVNVTITKTDNSSCTSPNGSAVASATGGQSPYTYAWSNSSTGSTLNGLTAGAYTVTVTDANGCEGTASTTVGDNTGSNLAATATATDETSATANDGTATVTATGGATPYTYAWDNGGTTATITGLDAGTYTVTVTDNNGCITTATATVGTSVGIVDIAAGFAFNLYPNPTGGNVIIALDFDEVQDVRIEWFNILGSKISTDELLDVKSINQAYNLSHMANGIYLARVTFGEHTIVERVSVNH